MSTTLSSVRRVPPESSPPPIFHPTEPHDDPSRYSDLFANKRVTLALGKMKPAASFQNETLFTYEPTNPPTNPS